MKPLYNQTEFDNAKSRDRLQIECLNCKQPFFRTKNDIKKSMLKHRNERHSFCSPNCQRTYEVPTIIVNCDECNKPIKKLPNQIKKTKHNFCNHSCAAKYNNSHKTKGTRVSKLELWFQEKLILFYPSLEFQFNRKDTINGELDIYIPSLKLAFELNGIFHYEPIYGPEKLASIKNNDCRKMQACIEHRIELCIIDTSSFKYFKEQQATKFLEIIKNIITIRQGLASNNAVSS